jgi:multiple sugar transport system substrate-binding protein
MKYLKYISCLFILIVAGSCSSDSHNRNTKIIYWSSNNTEEIQFARFIVDSWNKNNPEEKIMFQPVPEGQSSEEIILAAVVGKTTPDIYSNMWEGDVEAYAQAGVLVALDTLDGFVDFLHERCDSEVIAEVTSLDGHIYQIPWKINPIMMLYNKNIIKSLGYEKAPETYSEFFDASKKFQKDLNDDGYVDQWFGYAEVIVTWWQRFFDFYPLYLAASNGAPLVKNNKAAFNNEAGIKVFEFLRELYKHNYFPKERLSARQDVFLDGVIATRFTGPWEISHSEKFKPAGFEYDFQPMPVPDDHVGPAYTYGDPKNFVIFKTCSNPNLAWKFLKLTLNEENDLKFLEITNQLPRRKNLDINPKYSSYFEKNPKMKVFAKQAKYVKGTDQCPVLKEVFDLISVEYEACVIYGEKNPREALSDAEKAVNLLFLK